MWAILRRLRGPGDLPGTFGRQVLFLARVGFQVVKLDGGRRGVLDRLPVAEPDRLEARASLVQLPVEVWPRGCLAPLEQRHDRDPVGRDAAGQARPDQLGAGWQKIPERPGLVADPTRRDHAGPSGDTGLAQAPLVHRSLEPSEPLGLVKQLADLGTGRERRPVVAGNDHQRFVIDPEFLQDRQQASEIAVEAGDHRRVGLLESGPVLPGVVAQVVDLVVSMRQGHGVEQKKRLVPVRTQPGERVIDDQVRGVGLAVEIKPLVVAVEIAWKVIVSMSLAVISKKMIKSNLERTPRGIEHPHAPLAGTGRGIAVVLEQLRHGVGVRGKGLLAFRLDLAVRPDRAVSGVLTDQERRPGRSAHAGAAVRLGEPRSLACHPVEDGGLDPGLAVGPHVALGKVIGQHEDDVGPIGPHRRAGEHRMKCQTQQSDAIHDGWYSRLISNGIKIFPHDHLMGETSAMRARRRPVASRPRDSRWRGRWSLSGRRPGRRAGHQSHRRSRAASTDRHEPRHSATVTPARAGRGTRETLRSRLRRLPTIFPEQGPTPREAPPPQSRG